MSRWLAPVTCAIGGLCALGCRAPTEIDITVMTDVSCAAGVTGTDIQLSSSDSRSPPPPARSTQCSAQADGTSDLGKLVVLPGPSGGPVNVVVVTGVGQSADACLSASRPVGVDAGGCIVERRTWAFSSHEVVAGTVLMPKACQNVACPDGTTCMPTSAGVTCAPIPTCTASGCAWEDGGADAASVPPLMDSGAPPPQDSGIHDATVDRPEPSDSAAGSDSSAHDAALDAPGAPDATVDALGPTFTIGGTVSGLTLGDASLPLVLSDNGGAGLSITSNGPFTFPTALAAGASYDVVVAMPPENPSQTCGIDAGSGTVGDAGVMSVAVSCSLTSFTVGGTLVGLSGGMVGLSDGTSTVLLSANGTFATPNTLNSGQMYDVTVASQPEGQTCVVMNGTGTVTSSSITTILVTCTTSDFVAVTGTLTGLAMGDSILLTDNGSDSLSLMQNGPFAFAMPVMIGMPYAVTLGQSPTMPIDQTCVLAGASGTAVDGGVSGLSVTCTTNSFPLDVVVSNLDGTLGLSNGVGDAGTQQFGTNGTFPLGPLLPSGAMYDVTVTGNPIGQACVVTGGMGVIGASEVDVPVTCGLEITVKVDAQAGALVTLSLDGGPTVQTTGSGLAMPVIVSFPNQPVQGGMTYTITGSTTSSTCSPVTGIAGQGGTPTMTCP